MKKLMIGLCLSVVLSVIGVIPALTAYAQSAVTRTPVAQSSLQKVNEYFSTQTTTYSDGTMIDRSIINSPPVPPPGHELERAAVSVPESNLAMGTNTLTVPAFTWVLGCSAVSGSMIAGYYDRNGFPNIYTGPTNGGVVPLVEDSSWGTWTDGVDTYPNNPLIASHNGLDGRSIKGSIDDYWIQYGSSASDPYITGPWTQHTWGDSIGDYMKTSQSAYGNTDGSTTFWNYTTSSAQLTCADMESGGISDTDGTYGRKLFYEARGYTVSDCYSQKTDNTVAGGFSFTQYKAEIDAGHPVMLNLAGHTIVGVGYDDSSNTVYVHDTWDNSVHTMTWGGSYSGMGLLSVSIVNLLQEGTFGTQFVVTGTGFGTKKGRVLIGNIATKIINWTDISITCTATSVPLPAGEHDVTIKPNVKKAVPITLTGAFTVKSPGIATLSPDHGAPKTPITITGTFFGAKRGHVYLEYEKNGKTKKKACAVKSWTMDPTTGASAITFVVPAGLAAGSYPLQVTNKVGTAVTTFTID